MMCIIRDDVHELLEMGPPCLISFKCRRLSTTFGRELSTSVLSPLFISFTFSAQMICGNLSTFESYIKISEFIFISSFGPVIQ